MPVHSRATILLTRPRAASERFAVLLPGLEVIIAPLMEIVGTGADIELAGIAGLILTSEAVIPFLPATDLPAFCVGPRTTEAARAAGLDARQAGRDAETLVERLLADRPPAPLLHIHGLHQRGDVATRLTDGGLPCGAVVAYDQRALAPDARFRAALARDRLLVPLFSPRSAGLFAQAAKGPGFGPDTRLFALSNAVMDALPLDLRRHAATIAAPNGGEMARALQAAAMRRNSP